jgi:hypothetical protein
VALRGKSKKLQDFLDEKRPAAITEDLWRELVAQLAPISEGYLRRLLHATGLPIAQPFGGVRQATFEELESSLLEIGEEYARAAAAHDLARATACRRAVIQAKDHARLVSRNQKVDPEKRKQKEEMVEWMLVWLENPGIFESWAPLRKQAIACPKPPD